MWIYQNRIIKNISELPNSENLYGFVYKITNTSRMFRNELPFYYIGRKNTFSHRAIKLGKRELEALTDKRKSKKKIVIKESDWLKYAGSCKELLEDIKNGDEIVKEILTLCYSKINLTYSEVKALFVNEVLETEYFYNNNINAMWFRDNIGQ